MNKALVILAKEGYQDQEYAGTRSGLEEGGFEVIVGSSDIGECKGKNGGTVVATIALKHVNIADYDRIAFIGGPGAMALADNAEAIRIADQVAKTSKPLGAICIAPRILAVAGVLKGKRATVWNGDGEQAEFLTQHGAEFTGEAVTVDGSIVTGDGPKSAEEFGKVLAGL